MNCGGVVLVAMPWEVLSEPSIQLGILQSVLERAGIRTEVRSLKLAFMEHCLAATAELPESERLRLGDYETVAAEHYDVGLGPTRVLERSEEILATPDRGAVKLRLEPGQTIVLLGGFVAHALSASPGQTRIVSSLCYRLVLENRTDAPRRRGVRCLEVDREEG